MSLIDTGNVDEDGHPIVKSAMTKEEAWFAAMQGLSHQVLWMEPDIVLFISAFFAGATMLQMLRRSKLGPKVVILHTEAPYLPGQRAGHPGCVRAPEPAQRPGQPAPVPPVRPG
jgi:hypothetical protein